MNKDRFLEKAENVLTAHDHDLLVGLTKDMDWLKMHLKIVTVAVALLAAGEHFKQIAEFLVPIFGG